MVILGLHDNHGASAALLVDGKVVAAVEEERFTRLKMDSGFPKMAIDYLRGQYKEEFRNLDYVAIGCVYQSLKDFATKRYPLFGIKDFLIEEEKFWIPVLEGKNPNYMDVMKEYVNSSLCHYPLDTIKNPSNHNEIRKIRQTFIAEYLNIPIEKVGFVDHHACHAHHAYFSSPLRKDVLIFTIDGWGDFTNATVHSVEKNGELKCLYRTENCHIGHVYRFITMLLGMKPAEHEYKVMGLAAYAKEHYIREPLKVFEQTYYVDGLEFKIGTPIKNHYQYFKKRLEGFRFDAIAGAVQRYTENMLVQWVKNWVEHTGFSNVVFSGGLALNIKASKRISELPQIKDMFVCMASGDESLSIGAAQKKWVDLAGAAELQPITAPYLGPGFDEKDIKEALTHPFVRDHYKIIEKISLVDIAKLLVRGEIVAFMMSNMEFGPRALGHRSILADPRDEKIVRVINEAIKNRDFWMPFTPSILEERAEDYLINPKKLKAPYMTMAFDATQKAKDELKAAIHPYDMTLRPQVVMKKYSPRYHALIREFECLTGVGGLLNTSFNIHGKPIVRKPIDAIREVISHELVDLKYVVLDDVLLEKNMARKQKTIIKQEQLAEL